MHFNNMKDEEYRREFASSWHPNLTEYARGAPNMVEANSKELRSSTLFCMHIKGLKCALELCQRAAKYHPNCPSSSEKTSRQKNMNKSFSVY
jgi:hypothetical protein